MTTPILEIRDLHVWFRTDEGEELETVRGIDLDLSLIHI